MRDLRYRTVPGTVFLIPGLILLMRSVKRHYDRVNPETLLSTSVHTKRIDPPLLLPLERWSVMAEKAASPCVVVVERH